MSQLSNNWKQAYQELSSASISKSLQTIILALILLVVFCVRLATINIPPVDVSRWKEIDYIYVSQNFWKHGFNFFLPEESWPAEPPRVTPMELPVVPYTAAILYQFFGFNVYTVRAITLVASLVMIIFVFKLTRRELGPLIGLIAAFTAGVIPLYHDFNRYLFTEPTMIALSVMSIYYIAEWVDHGSRKDWILACITFSLTIALKVESLYLFLPIAWIAFRKYRWSMKQYKNLAILIIISMILPVLWYGYAYYLENTGAHLFSVFKGHNKSQTLFMLSQFHWYTTMGQRIIIEILGGIYGTVLFLIGVIAAGRVRKAGLIFAYLVSVGIYFVMVAEGNIDAPYRQLTIIPSVSIFVAIGIFTIVVTCIACLKTLKGFPFESSSYPLPALLASLVMVIIIPLIMINTIFPKVGPPRGGRWAVAQEIQKLTNPDGKLIVIGEYTKHVGGYDLSPVLYYYSNRQGWTLTPVDWNMGKIEELRSKGATLFVVVPRYNNFPEAVNYQPEESTDAIVNEVKAKYPVLFDTQDGIIIDLR